MCTTLNFWGSSKTERTGEDICKETPDIEFEQDWSVGSGSTLEDGKKFFKYFFSFRDFSGKIR